jgi:hypothetical protein
MKLGLKITALVVSCFLFQGQYANAAKTDADATKQLNETMKSVSEILKSHGYSLDNLINHINGLKETNKNIDALENETSMGEAPVLVVEKTNDGQLVVLASRRARGENPLGLKLTDDSTHQAIVKEIQSQGLDKPVVHNYQDKSGAWFRVLAWPINLLEAGQKPENRTQGRFIYVATEVEILPDAASAKQH